MDQESQAFSLGPLRPISILRPLGYTSHILSLLSNFSVIFSIFFSRCLNGNSSPYPVFEVTIHLRDVLGILSILVPLRHLFCSSIFVFTDFLTSEQHLRHFFRFGLYFRHIFYGLAQAYYPPDLHLGNFSFWSTILEPNFQQFSTFSDYICPFL